MLGIIILVLASEAAQVLNDVGILCRHRNEIVLPPAPGLLDSASAHGVGL